MWGLGCVGGCRPAAAGQSGRRRLSYILDTGDIWCVSLLIEIWLL